MSDILQHPSAQRLIDWLEVECSKGLIDFRIFRTNRSTNPVALIDEINEALSAPTVPDPELI